MNRKFYLLPLLLCLLQIPVYAQEKDTTTEKKYDWKKMVFGDYTHRKGKVYMTWGGDGPLLSFGDISYVGEHVRNIPRFTFFFNVGHNFNYDFNRNFGIFSGLNIKNIGLITKEEDLKLKRRVYTLGIPVGFKVGDLGRGAFFFFAGGSYDLAFNYKEKQFIDGDKKHKFNEWFSDRTPLLMPSVFAGLRMSPGFGLKVQYYPNNFFNRDFKETVNGVATYPYRDLDAKMFFATLSYDFGRIPYKKHFKWDMETHRDAHRHKHKKRKHHKED